MYLDKELDMPDQNLWRITADHENNFLFVYIFSVWKNKSPNLDSESCMPPWKII